MKRFRRMLLVAVAAAAVVPWASHAPATASEVCAEGYVLDQNLPGCNNCPPGVSTGPSGVRPFTSVFFCVHP